MKGLLSSFLLIICFMFSGCANIAGASKSSTSLFSFLGISELPDWYIRSKYSYPDSQWIENDFGLKVHYRDLGEGPVVLLLHGELSSMHTWEGWISTLSQTHRVIAVDLPGSGLTGAPHCVDDPADTCPENLNEDYIRHTLYYFIEDLGLRNFSLVGSSYGGYLAARYALDNPHRVDKLTLVAPMGYQQEVPDMLDYMTAPGFDFLNSYIQPATVISTVVGELYADSENLQQAQLERYIHLAQSDGAHRANVEQLKLVRTLMEHGTLADFSKISNKTLIIWGEYDNWGDFKHGARWTEEVDGALLVNHTFLGHIPMEESPDNTIADVVAFLNDDPLPSLETGGTDGSFTIKDAVKGLDQESLFGPPK